VYRSALSSEARLRSDRLGGRPSTRFTLGLWLSSGTYSRLVSTVSRAPGWECRMARNSGVVRRMSPMELKRTARTFGMGLWSDTGGTYSLNGKR
jgi:hypothetical protein